MPAERLQNGRRMATDIHFIHLLQNSFRTAAEVLQNVHFYQVAAERSFAPFATTFISCILIGPYKMATRRSFLAAREDISTLANQRLSFFAVTRPLVSGGVRASTPAWSRDIAR